MTITYHSGKRLQGISTGIAGSTATISDDFSSDNFTDVGSGVGVNTTNQTLGGTFPRGAIAKSYDPITALSDTAWVMRFKFNLTSHSGSPTGVYIGVTDTSNATDTTNTNRDAIMFWTYSDGGTKYAISHPTGTVFGLSYTDMTTTPSNGDVYYVELKRTSATTGTCSLYSDSGFSTLVEAKDFTIPSGASNTGLDNILITNLSDGGSGGTTIATIEDLKIYDGVTSFTPASSDYNSATNVPNGSRFEETDTRKFYTKDVNGWQEKGTALGYRHASTYAQNQPAEENPFTTINKQHFVEWFSGSSLPSYWNLWTLGSPVTQMSDSVDGGYEIYVNTTNYQASISFDDLGRQYSHNSSVFICVSETSESAGTQGQGLISLEADTQCVSNDGYIFQVSNGVYFITSDGTRGVTNTGLTPDANPHVYKGEAKASSCEGSVDGVLKATNTTNLPAIKLQPMFWKKMGSTSGTAKIRYFEAYNT